MRKLSYNEIQNKLQDLPGWEYLENRIEKEFPFNTYMSGIEFVNQIAERAERYNHHPELYVGWCRVKVAFTSHDSGGVTERDIRMAKVVENLMKASNSLLN